MAPCIGVYFQIGDNECFVAHLDSHTATTVEDRWKNIRKLAINTRDAFHARVVAAFPHAALDHLGALRLVVNQGDYPSYALAWGVSEAFKKMKDHGYVFHDPEEFSTNVTAVQALQVPDTMSGMGFAVDKVKNGNDIPVVWGLASNWVRKGQYGVAGFTFTDQ
ncbi:hypothetical protein BDY19DRAFT_82223 [Irpex rosettiformis]|uniref:Uncharacterized protein n=1 Tax=Irpex rosettiformis TaxID=378272 RepID=A0ACB8U626_9APHY|nr:hypothetical protein BDY19DRAFT_82223 [Irpex rosettiformis]